MPTKKRIQYRYTPTGQRSALIDPDGGRFTYTYDSVQRLTQVINPQGERTSYSYDAAGRRTVKKLANGSRTSFSYDAASRITSVAHLKSDSSVQASFGYQYDQAGNRTSLSEADGSRTTWSYDAAYQLTAEHRTGSNPYRNTYVYDNRGNRTLKNLDGARTTSSYDDANQLKWSQDASGRTTYTFDADGNQHVVLSPSGDRVTNLWDYENRLIGVLHAAGSRETMAYDPDGKRVKLQETASTTKYVWDDQNYLQEANASDVTQVTYTNEPRTYGNLISQRKASASHYYLFDALGSTRLVTDASENISESLLYDAWGNLVGSAPTMAVPFRWVGELGYLFVPVTSDYYVRARVYQPGIGRWVSKDPIGSFIGLNVLQYVDNRNFAYVDPSGLQHWTDAFPRFPSGSGGPQWDIGGGTGWTPGRQPPTRPPRLDKDLSKFPICGAVHYDPKGSCCENGRVVDKSPVYAISRGDPNRWDFWEQIGHLDLVIPLVGLVGYFGMPNNQRGNDWGIHMQGVLYNCPNEWWNSERWHFTVPPTDPAAALSWICRVDVCPSQVLDMLDAVRALDADPGEFNITSTNCTHRGTSILVAGGIMERPFISPNATLNHLRRELGAKCFYGYTALEDHVETTSIGDVRYVQVWCGEKVIDRVPGPVDAPW